MSEFEFDLSKLPPLETETGSSDSFDLRNLSPEKPGSTEMPTEPTRDDVAEGIRRDVFHGAEGDQAFAEGRTYEFTNPPIYASGFNKELGWMHDLVFSRGLCVRASGEYLFAGTADNYADPTVEFLFRVDPSDGGSKVRELPDNQ